MTNKLPKRTTVSLSPYNTQRVNELIDELKPYLGPRINFSILIEDAINTSFDTLITTYRERAHISSKKFKEQR